MKLNWDLGSHYKKGLFALCSLVSEGGFLPYFLCKYFRNQNVP